MVNQDELSGDSRDLIEEQIIEDHGLVEEDEIDDYNTHFDMINE